jgi:hypothetical protein
MKELMNNQMKTSANVSQVACAVFAKILAVNENENTNGVVKLRDCSSDERAYIAGGGLNVSAIDNTGISIFYPTGFVLEVLEALLGRTASFKPGDTVISYLRVHKVNGFGVKGHLFEWLIAYDISCARSEFNTLMEAHAIRDDACIGVQATSDPQVYLRIMDANVAPGIWVVRDTHLNSEDRWVDVAYSIKCSDAYEMGLIECKTGYENKAGDLRGFCTTFFTKAERFARQHTGCYFVAAFVCEHAFDVNAPRNLPTNMVTAVQTITKENCPTMFPFLAADPTNEESNDALAQRFAHAAVASPGGAECYAGGSQLI